MYLPLGISNIEMKMSLTQIPLGVYNDDDIVHLYCIYLCKSTFPKIGFDIACFIWHFFQTIVSWAFLLKHHFAVVMPKYDAPSLCL